MMRKEEEEEEKEEKENMKRIEKKNGEITTFNGK